MSPKKLQEQQLWNVANTLHPKMIADEYREYNRTLSII